MTRVAEPDLTHRLATRAVHAEYARTRNPTREALERNVAALEGGLYGFAFGSGLAALDGVMKLLSAGDHVVSGENVYGGSHRQMTHIWSRLGLSFTFVD